MKSILLLSLCLTLPALADEKPLLAIPGKVVYENALAGLPEEWKAAKGKWEAADGGLRGAELPEDKHGAVIRLTKPLQNFIVQYEVKFDGAKLSSLSINDAKGHLARVGVTPTSVSVTKDDHDHDGPDRAVVFGRLQADLKPGAWHTVRMEMVGTQLVGRVDEVVACGTHEQLATAKANLGLTVAGQSAVFRNLSIREATLNPDWDTVKAALPKGTPVPTPTPRAPKPAPKT